MTQQCQQAKWPIAHFFCNALAYLGLCRVSYSSAEMTSAERIGANVKALRLAKDITQVDLGERIGSDGPRIGRLEKGVENPTVETLDKLAAALAVDVHRLTMPRPEEGVTGHGDQRTQGASIRALEQLLIDRLDEEAPADDSARGDILRAQHALASAQAALNRALRRADEKSGAA